MKNYIYKILIFNKADYKTADNISRYKLENYPEGQKNVLKKALVTLVFIASIMTLMNISCVSSKTSKVEGIITPTNLARVAMATNSADLEWTINYDEDFLQYKVYRGTKANVAINSDYKMVFQSDQKYSTKCTDWGLQSGTKYYYKVFVYNQSGNYAASNEVMGETPMAATVVANGDIIKDTVWKKESSPVTVKGDVVVPAGVKLTIEPGVSVRFSSNDLQGGGAYIQKTELIIRGTLIAEGTVLDPISFVSNERYYTAGDWGGIRFESSGGGSNNRMKYCKIMHASTAIAVENTPVTLESLQISHILNYGIVTSASSAAIKNCQINDVGQDQSESAMIYMKIAPNPYVYNCVLSFCNGNGIFIESGTAVIDHNIIAECNQNGVYCIYEALESVTDNAIINNRVGIKNSTSQNTDIKPDFNNVYDTAEYSYCVKYSGCSAGLNSVSGEPKFVSANYKMPELGDFSIEATSVMLKKGQSGSDIGLQNPLKYGVKY